MASLCTTIAVDGQDGDDIAKARLRANDPSRALVRYGLQGDKNGQDGQDARAPLNGGPAGSLAVELTESADQVGYIHAHTIRWEGPRQPVLSTEIPPRHRLLLSAAGGRGEAGGIGGDGTNGLQGANGRDATERDDAGDGSEGGDGGNAGCGSHGGNGGQGGSIQILLDAHNTHLLFAVRCNVVGGEGGPAGKHGKIGMGGEGGVGGAAIEWEQYIGFKYFCTPNCLTGTAASRSTASSSSQSLIRISSTLSRTSTQLRTAMGSQLVPRGGNLQAVVAALATRYHARPENRVDHGLCRCAGGGAESNCLGCDYKRISKTLRRTPGQNGARGHDGIDQVSVLEAGVPGDPGDITIVVRNFDGTLTEYSEAWQLRLVSFDVEDENGDGIFEPGENIVVRRIAIENYGGMPSPLQGAELLIRPSEHFATDQARKLFVPSSIAPQSIVTLEGYICARIAQPEAIQVGTRYTKRGLKISLIAVVPWLNCKLPNFDLEKSFDVQFPCSLSAVNLLASVSPGSSSTIEWQVQNHGGKALGVQDTPTRALKVVVSIPSAFGELESSDAIKSGDHVEVPIEITHIGPSAMITSSEILKILPETRAPAQIDVDLTLYIYNAAHGYSDEVPGPILVPAHRVRATARISESYRYNSSADFLLVANSQTSPERIKALQQFIRTEMGMVADCWDINLNGGLQTQEKGESAHLFSLYSGKTIILLGERFRFLDREKTSISELCDSRQFRKALDSKTSFLALGLQDDQATKDLFRRVVFDVQETHDNLLSCAPKSAKFTTVVDLASAIAGQKRNSSEGPTEFILAGIQRRWYSVFTPKLESQCRSASRKLRKYLPQTRFLFSHAQQDPQEQASSQESMVVLLGADRNVSLKTTERRKQTSNTLDTLEKYSIVAALPPIQRVQKICLETAYEDEETSFVTECAICSLALDCIKEIDNYSYSVLATGDVETGEYQRTDLIDLHLSTIAALLSSLGSVVPEPAIQVLAYCLAACRTQSKREMIARAFFFGVSTGRKLAIHLEDLIQKRTGEHGTLLMGTIRERVAQLRAKRKDTLYLVLDRASTLTKVSRHAFVHSTDSSLDLVPGSRTFSNHEWDKWFDINQKSWTRIAENEQQATQTLRRRLTVGNLGHELPG